jgi:hypothetical protein
MQPTASFTRTSHLILSWATTMHPSSIRYNLISSSNIPASQLISPTQGLLTKFLISHCMVHNCLKSVNKSIKWLNCYNYDMHLWGLCLYWTKRQAPDSHMHVAKERSQYFFTACSATSPYWSDNCPDSRYLGKFNFQVIRRKDHHTALVPFLLAVELQNPFPTYMRDSCSNLVQGISYPNENSAILQKNAKTAPQLGKDLFLPNSFYFTI